ncbi:MAG TPA: hypothetical protein ENI82_04260 [Bacteroidetes bacterium]|nr:hypothetical protein [Bacteroidota bacterium]
MKTKILKFIFLLTISFSIFSCMDNRTETEKKVDEIEDAIDKGADNLKDGIEEGVEGIKDAIGEIKKSLKKDKDGKKVELTNFRELKKLMPDEIAGIEQSSNTGETSGAFGFKVSTAKAKYEDGDQWVEIEIVDGAGIGFAMLGMAAWTATEIDRETDDGYEKTTTFEGYKAYEKWNEKRQKAELAFLVNDRYIISVNARNVPMKKLKRDIGRMKFRKLK